LIDATFATTTLPSAVDAIAPDGSEVRTLAAAARGGLAHVTLAGAATSIAIRHRTVEELWFSLSGRGRMWRRDDVGAESIVEVARGDSVSISCGTHFPFRTTGDDALVALGCTMPPWPGDGEGSASPDGPWEPTGSPGAGSRTSSTVAVTWLRGLQVLAGSSAGLRVTRKPRARVTRPVPSRR
jgi:mannose-6-phosphate isomerase-like protein (cupin superfamily)